MFSKQTEGASSEPMEIDLVGNSGGGRDGMEGVESATAMVLSKVDEPDTVPILESIGGLRLGRSGGKRGNFTTALRRATSLRKRQEEGHSGSCKKGVSGGSVFGARTSREPKSADRRVQKERNLEGLWNDYDSPVKDAEDDTPFSSRYEPPATNAMARHQQMTFILAGYLQLIFNVVIVGVILYALVSFALNVRTDIQLKVQEEVSVIKSEIERCKFNFYDNRCHEADMIVPRMREQCAQWAACANRDPAAAAYQTRLTAEFIAEVVNSFIEPISYKTMVFAVGVIVAVTLISNLAFYMARSKLPVDAMGTAGELRQGHPQTPSSVRQECYPSTPQAAPRRLEFY